jgi:hypothetical protein
LKKGNEDVFIPFFFVKEDVFIPVWTFPHGIYYFCSCSANPKSVEVMLREAEPNGIHLFFLRVTKLRPILL